MSAAKADMLYVVVYVLPEHVWSKVETVSLERSSANETPIVGSGPFQITYYKRGDYTRTYALPRLLGQRRGGLRSSQGGRDASSMPTPTRTR